MDDVNVEFTRKEIVKLDLAVKAFVQDILHCEGPTEVLYDINQEVRHKLGDLKTKIQDLERLGNEQAKETDAQYILREVDSHRKQLASTQAALRRANLTCQLTIEQREKDQLYSKTNEEVRKRPISGKEDVAKTASGITENLMRLSKMMASQVERSEETMHTLVSSSAKIIETQDEFKSMKGHIQNSRKLLSKYARRDCSDKILIFFAAVFFFATVLYIVKKRLFPT